MLPTDLPGVITAVGGLGTAAFGLVDATKPIFGTNHIGFEGIRSTVRSLTPANAPGANTLSPDKILATLEANWINGTDLASQKSIAKSLIKLNLSATTAAALASATGVDPDTLTTIAVSMASSTSLTSPQSDVYARFDLIVTAMLDECYQRGDQIYRNGTRLIAMAMAIVLAVAGGIVLDGGWGAWFNGKDVGESLIVGLLSTPLAPVAKDISSALATAVNTMQMIKK